MRHDMLSSYKKKLGQASTGPFEVPVSSSDEREDGISPNEVERELVRELDCANYTTCLKLAAALNWESFTCEGCNGEINQSLTWRAGQSAVRDKVVKFLCGGGMVKVLRGKEKS